MNKHTGDQVAPDRIMQTAMGFWPAKTLLSAIKLDLFSYLSAGPRSGPAIQSQLGLHERSLYDFLDALVALGFLEREGIGRDARYRNTADSAQFLVRTEPSYIGGFLEMANDRLYPFWADLEEGLRSGKPQNETKHGDHDLFDTLYEDQERLDQFLSAMAGVQMGAFMALVEKFDFSPYRTLLDVGGASAALSIQVARHHDHIHCLSTDLPPVEPIARQRIREAALDQRVEARTLDFWQENFPSADVITMGNILHDWGLAEKKRLIDKAYRALNDGGALIVIENVIDDERRKNAFGLMMSLNMLIETRQGFDFTAADFDGWAREIGFESTSLLPLAGPANAVIAYKHVAN